MTQLAIASASVSASAVHSTGWLKPLGDNWPAAVCRLLATSPVVVRVLIAEKRGSAPREAGACMLVTAGDSEGTVGGGNLEYQALLLARPLLMPNAPPASVHRLILGRELGQCCGGVVQLWIERFTRTDLSFLQSAAHEISQHGSAHIEATLTPCAVTRKLLSQAAVRESRVQLVRSNEHAVSILERVKAEGSPLWLYGAGHVGQAIVHTLAELPFRVTWVDSRAACLPADVPDNARVLHAASPVETVSSAPAGCHFLVLTHDHALDYALCSAILQRSDFAWAGLIGSESKGARFRSRLRRDGFSPESIARLVCPIGIAGIASKLPAAIAIAVAAQLLQNVTAVHGHAIPSAHTSSSESAAARIALTSEHDCTATDCASCRRSGV